MAPHRRIPVLVQHLDADTLEGLLSVADYAPKQDCTQQMLTSCQPEHYHQGWERKVSAQHEDAYVLTPGSEDRKLRRETHCPTRHPEPRLGVHVQPLQ